jgi:hypothetical protein
MVSWRGIPTTRAIIGTGREVLRAKVGKADELSQ